MVPGVSCWPEIVSTVVSLVSVLPVRVSTVVPGVSYWLEVVLIVV